LYNILIEIGITRKLVRLIKIYSKSVVKSAKVKIYLTYFLLRRLEKGDALSSLLFNFSSEYAVRMVPRKSGETSVEWNTSVPGLYW
jgi:hypothetical protein